MKVTEEYVKQNGKKVRLQTETVIEDPYGDRQVLKHTGYGHVYVKDGTFAVFYVDKQGTETNRILLYGTENSVKMERDGSAKGVLVFTLGEEIHTRYILAYGEIEICIQTIEIECILNEDEGTIALTYYNELNGTAKNRSRYICRWKS